MKKITKKQLLEVYRTDYWDKCRCDSLPSGVDYAVFDSAVNSGPGRAAVWLQGAVGAVKDGGIGPNTMAKVATHEPVQIINDTLDQRMTFLRSLRTFPTFGRGWTRRVTGERDRWTEHVSRFGTDQLEDLFTGPSGPHLWDTCGGGAGRRPRHEGRRAGSGTAATP